MRPSHRLFLALFVLAAGPGLAGCRIQKPTLSLQDARLRSLGLSGVEVGVTFVVDNPNSFALKVGDLSCRFDVAGEELFSARAKGNQQYAPAQGQTRIEASTLVEYARLWHALKEYASGTILQYRFEVSGDFYLGPIPIPVTVGRNREHKHGPGTGSGKGGWSLKIIRFPGGGRMELVFTVVNGSQREMPVPGVVGRLSCNGKPLLEVERPAVQTIPPGQTMDVAFPVRVHLLEITKAAGRALLGEGETKFEGNFRLDPPLSVVK